MSKTSKSPSARPKTSLRTEQLWRPQKAPSETAKARAEVAQIHISRELPELEPDIFAPEVIHAHLNGKGKEQNCQDQTDLIQP